MFLSIIIGLTIIAAALYGLITGYREVQILVSRGSWRWIRFKKWLYKFTDQNSNDKNEDSFHISNGIAVVIVSLAFSFIIYLVLNLAWWWILINTVLFWVFIFYIRNVTMHVLIPKWQKDNPQLKLWYLIPLFGKFIQIKKEK